jgi:polyisoprenoid-binding protein YceI
MLDGQRPIVGGRRSGSFRWLTAIAGLVAVLLGAATATAGTWRLSRGPSAVNFTIRHLILSEVEGRFTRFTGSVDCPDDDFTKARIEATIDVESVYTGHEDRDRHLRSDEFFAAAKFPWIRFASRSVRRTGPDRYEIVGDLTIRGITREIVLAAKSTGRRATSAGDRLDFQATGSVNRSDYDLRWNDIWEGRALLGEKVRIELKVVLVESRQPAP